MTLTESFYLLGMPWARIYFVENEGMAFGLTFGGNYGKLFLSLFRILAVTFLFYYIGKLIKIGAPFGLLISFALILAGAVGNIIDSAVYGMIFSASCKDCDPAVLFPDSGGYAGFLHGKVVDMFYFPLFKGTFPEWLPFWGGERYEFFRPVFNLADTSITIGVLSILIFQRSFFSDKNESADEKTSEIEEPLPSSSNEAEDQVDIPTKGEGDSRESNLSID